MFTQSIELIFEDLNLLILNKPAGMPCHPFKKYEKNTALYFAVKCAPEIATVSNDWREGGLCHRLDNNTSGLLLFAKNKKTWLKMRLAVSKGLVYHIYFALIQGILMNKLIMDQPIAHHFKKKKKMVIAIKNNKYRGKARAAKTIINSIERGKNVTFIKAYIKGGCRHQIRVHLKYNGYPIIGDILYGGIKASYLPGQALHAGVLILPNGRNFKTNWSVFFRNEAKIYNITVPQLN